MCVLIRVCVCVFAPQAGHICVTVESVLQERLVEKPNNFYFWLQSFISYFSKYKKINYSKFSVVSHFSGKLWSSLWFMWWRSITCLFNIQPHKTDVHFMQVLWNIWPFIITSFKQESKKKKTAIPVYLPFHQHTANIRVKVQIVSWLIHGEKNPTQLYALTCCCPEQMQFG